MKNVGFLLAVAFFLGLGLSPAYGYQKDSETIATSQELKKEVKQVADAKDTSWKKETEKYQKKVQKELKEYKKKMKELQAKGRNLSDKAKVEAKEEMGELKQKMDVAEQKLKSMKTASGEAWRKMKSEVDSAMESVKESFEKIAAHFK